MECVYGWFNRIIIKLRKIVIGIDGLNNSNSHN